MAGEALHTQFESGAVTKGSSVSTADYGPRGLELKIYSEQRFAPEDLHLLKGLFHKLVDRMTQSTPEGKTLGHEQPDLYSSLVANSRLGSVFSAIADHLERGPDPKTLTSRALLGRTPTDDINTKLQTAQAVRNDRMQGTKRFERAQAEAIRSAASKLRDLFSQQNSRLRSLYEQTVNVVGESVGQRRAKAAVATVASALSAPIVGHVVAGAPISLAELGFKIESDEVTSGESETLTFNVSLQDIADACRYNVELPDEILNIVGGLAFQETPAPSEAPIQATEPAFVVLEGTIEAVNGVNIRQGPDRMTDAIDSLKNNKPVQINGYHINEADEMWFHTQDGGWVLGQLVNGIDISQLPKLDENGIRINPNLEVTPNPQSQPLTLNVDIIKLSESGNLQDSTSFKTLLADSCTKMQEMAAKPELGVNFDQMAVEISMLNDNDQITASRLYRVIAGELTDTAIVYDALNGVYRKVNTPDDTKAQLGFYLDGSVIRHAVVFVDDSGVIHGVLGETDDQEPIVPVGTMLAPSRSLLATQLAPLSDVPVGGDQVPVGVLEVADANFAPIKAFVISEIPEITVNSTNGVDKITLYGKTQVEVFARTEDGFLVFRLGNGSEGFIRPDNLGLKDFEFLGLPVLDQGQEQSTEFRDTYDYKETDTLRPVWDGQRRLESTQVYRDGVLFGTLPVEPLILLGENVPIGIEDQTYNFGPNYSGSANITGILLDRKTTTKDIGYAGITLKNEPYAVYTLALFYPGTEVGFKVKVNIPINVDRNRDLPGNNFFHTFTGHEYRTQFTEEQLFRLAEKGQIIQFRLFGSQYSAEDVYGEFASIGVDCDADIKCQQIIADIESHRGGDREALNAWQQREQNVEISVGGVATFILNPVQK